MKKDSELTKKRNELKQEITNGMDGLLAGLVFDRVSRLTQRLGGRSNPPSLYYTTAIVAIIILIPGLVATTILEESDKFKKIGLTVSVYLEFSLIALITARINMRRFLENVRDHVIDSIDSVKNLTSLRLWLPKLWTTGKSLSFGLVFGFLVTAVVVKFTSQSVGEFIGIGATISYQR